MAKQDTLLNIVKRQPGCTDLHLGIVESFQAYSPELARARWGRAKGVEGLTKFERDVPATEDNQLDALKIASAAKMIAREFVGQERVFILAEDCISVTGPLMDADDILVWRVQLHAG